MIRRPPRSTLSSSSAASDVYKRRDLEGCRSSVVQPRWWDAHRLPAPRVASLPVVYRTRGHRSASSVGVWRARDREADGALSVDDLERAPPKRRDAPGTPRLPRVERTVARRLSGATTEGRQARGQRCASRLRPGASLGRGASSRRDPRGGTGRQLAKEEGAALSGPQVGAGLEPRADRAALGGRFPP